MTSQLVFIVVYLLLSIVAIMPSVDRAFCKLSNHNNRKVKS